MRDDEEWPPPGRSTAGGVRRATERSPHNDTLPQRMAEQACFLFADGQGRAGMMVALGAHRLMESRAGVAL